MSLASPVTARHEYLAQGSAETILVVDDDPGVLRIVVLMLADAGFVVLSATSGPAALKLAEELDGKIDLLLSDVDMPFISGPDLGERLQQARPDMRVMLMSGGANGSRRILNYGWAFLPKPFGAEKLVEMVNVVLHAPDLSQPAGQSFDSRKDFHRKA